MLGRQLIGVSGCMPDIAMSIVGTQSIEHNTVIGSIHCENDNQIAICYSGGPCLVTILVIETVTLRTVVSML